MVERLGLFENIGGIGLRPEKDGEFVRHDDYAALQRENEELRAELKQANLAVESLNICIKQDDELAAALRAKLETAERQLADLAARSGDAPALNMPTDPNWYQRKAALENNCEVSAGKRLTSTVNPTPDELAELERLALDSLPKWARDEIVAARSGVPEGWKLMPVEPTDAMLDSFAEAMSDARDRIRQRNIEAGRDNPHGMAVSEWFSSAYADMLLASPAAPQADGWRDMSSAPKDGTPIIGWCVHDVEPYHDEKTGNLTDYGCHVEALGRVQDGPHFLVWGGADSDYDEWSGKTLSWPDWWFRFGSEFEEAANPVAWMPLPTAPTPAPAEGR